MTIDKYPCVVWEEDGFRVVATLKGPKLERFMRPTGKAVEEWIDVDLGPHSRVLLKAYHALLQECQGPMKDVDFKGEPKPAPAPPPAPANESTTKGAPPFVSKFGGPANP